MLVYRKFRLVRGDAHSSLLLGYHLEHRVTWEVRKAGTNHFPQPRRFHVSHETPLASPQATKLVVRRITIRVERNSDFLLPSLPTEILRGAGAYAVSGKGSLAEAQGISTMHLDGPSFGAPSCREPDLLFVFTVGSSIP